MKRTNFEVFGGRSFALAVYVFHIGAVMRWFDKLDNPTFGMLATGSVLAIILKSSADLHTTKRAEVQVAIAEKQAEASPPTTVEQVQT